MNTKTLCRKSGIEYRGSLQDRTIQYHQYLLVCQKLFNFRVVQVNLSSKNSN